VIVLGVQQEDSYSLLQTIDGSEEQFIVRAAMADDMWNVLRAGQHFGFLWHQDLLEGYSVWGRFLPQEVVRHDTRTCSHRLLAEVGAMAVTSFR